MPSAVEEEQEPVLSAVQAKKPMDSYQPMTGNQMAVSSGRTRPTAVSQPAVQPERTAVSSGRSGRDRYRFPSPDLLAPRKKKKGADSDRELKETAERLEQILGNFGVKVSVTQYSRGPSVTRYELQPEQGVKVSKIVGLADDIKLNLAATDIRIEAPIPVQEAAVGIEVPNKENSAVAPAGYS